MFSLDSCHVFGFKSLNFYSVFGYADIRRSTRPFLDEKTEDEFFQIDVRFPQNPFFFHYQCLGVDILLYMQVRVCSGKPTTIVASRKGFYPAGKSSLLSHSLVGLLQQISRIFDAVSQLIFFHPCLHLFHRGSLQLKVVCQLSLFKLFYFCRLTKLS